jgi:hypothetical protein
LTKEANFGFLMEKISLNDWPEIVFGSSDSRISQAIRRAVSMGDLRKIAPNLYTSNLNDKPEAIIKRHLYAILGEHYPGAVLSHRTAFEGGLSPESTIVLTYKYTKRVQLPGIIIRLVKGLGPQKGDTSFINKLFLASRERALLENLQFSRKRADTAKTLPSEYIEHYLDKLCRTYGVEELNLIRDKAKKLAVSLNLSAEFKRLDSIIGALQGTREAGVLKTPAALARAAKMPYDAVRLDLLVKLVLALQENKLYEPLQSTVSQAGLNNLAFFESYFSNYIEGTEFEVDEAADIIFRGKIVPNRPEDAHDILGTFKIVSNIAEMQKTPDSVEALFNLLKHRHSELLGARKDKEPGKFKAKLNRAGNTVFVHPDMVTGTLAKGFELYLGLQPGMARAMFMMFLIAEVHPFLDGNGRIARLMMNSELVSSNESRIIIPTVYREDYILTLRRLSRAGDTDPYIRMLRRAQAFTASIDFSDYNKAIHQLKKCHAFLDPSEGKLVF